MKKNLSKLSLALGVVLLGESCTTAYDRSGRAQKVVTPEAALVGVAAAGVVAYSLGKNRSRKYRQSDYGRGGDYGRNYHSNNYRKTKYGNLSYPCRAHGGCH